MKNKTNTTTNEVAVPALADLQINADLKASIFIVSVLANLFIFTTWIALQVTSQYDMQLASFLFTR